ncbi:hypothetical protein A2U01_0070960, partial [Trifolium medium]|nr:hypothetical protein [Trifolium medium]
VSGALRHSVHSSRISSWKLRGAPSGMARCACKIM